MSAARNSDNARAAVRMRRLDAGMMAEMARSLHRDAARERECVRGRDSGRTREVAGAIEARRRARVPRARTSRPRSAAQTA